MRNLVALCGAAGECAEVVKLTVYLVQMSDYPVLNELMETLWQPPYPARAVVGVRELPRGALIEVEAVLFI
ncbi:endoribonuclease L-PSP [mine drainage metagenome]|uniref:Endoribonuclease L-PSP n=1 Tax=mine drainage metagenome TaxID=410659 RepID=T1BNT9_9ZZZZ